MKKKSSTVTLVRVQIDNKVAQVSWDLPGQEVLSLHIGVSHASGYESSQNKAIAS